MPAGAREVSRNHDLFDQPHALTWRANHNFISALADAPAIAPALSSNDTECSSDDINNPVG